MIKKQFKLTAILVLALLVALVGVASAKPSKPGNVDLKDATINWGPLSGGSDELQYQCSGIPDGLLILPDANGSDREKTAKVKELKNGGRRITLDDTVSGTASDQNGGTYTYLYKNKSTFTYDGDGTVYASTIDTFRMKGGDVNYVVNFNWRWNYAAGSLELVEVYDNGTLVNLEVDPFFFATDDGFLENPNINPGTWQQVHTNGFIWGCDPI